MAYLKSVTVESTSILTVICDIKVSNLNLAY